MGVNALMGTNALRGTLLSSWKSVAVSVPRLERCLSWCLDHLACHVQ